VSEPSSRLARRLGTTDAVFIGLGAMVGAGIFAAIAPAAARAGTGALPALAVAAAVAWLNAGSVAALSRILPQSGGAYAYGRARLGAVWGFVAGWAFVAGKLASCAAMALTFGSYAAPGERAVARALAVAAVAGATAVNVVGIERTAAWTRAIVAVVLASLVVAVAAIVLGGGADPGRVVPRAQDLAPGRVLGAAGYLFFAFAGYARIATLGEEVRDPERTIPRAIALAFAIALAAYAVVLAAALSAVDVDELARSPAPLALAVASGGGRALAPVVRVGATVASLGVLLSLLAGIARTAFAMAAERDLPHGLAAVHPRTRVPHRAQVATGVLVAAAAALADLRGAIGFSSFTVLVYYAVANAAAWTLRRDESARAPALALLGCAGCLTVAFTLPAASVAVGLGVLAAGVSGWIVFGRAGRRAR